MPTRPKAGRYTNGQGWSASASRRRPSSLLLGLTATDGDAKRDASFQDLETNRTASSGRKSNQPNTLGRTSMLRSPLVLRGGTRLTEATVGPAGLGRLSFADIFQFNSRETMGTSANPALPAFNLLVGIPIAPEFGRLGLIVMCSCSLAWLCSCSARPLPPLAGAPKICATYFADLAGRASSRPGWRNPRKNLNSLSRSASHPLVVLTRRAHIQTPRGASAIAYGRSISISHARHLILRIALYPSCRFQTPDQKPAQQVPRHIIPWFIHL